MFRCVADLGVYPEWLDIVPRAVPEDGDEPAWVVDLRGRLGPFARSKRLRMMRTTDDPPKKAVFERRERDNRSHSPWVLQVDVEPAGSGSRPVMHLHYGGARGAPGRERILGDEIEHSEPRLLAPLARCR